MAIEHNIFYQASNLKDNPFRALPVQDVDPRMGVWVGYTKEKDTLVKYIERTRNDMVGNVNFLLLYGDLGTGKSHSMLWSKHYIQTTADFNSLAFYVPTLKKDNGRLTFAGALKHDIVDKTNLLDELIGFKHFLEQRIAKYKEVNGRPDAMSKDDCLKEIIPSYDLFTFAKLILHCETVDQVRSIVLPDKMSDYQATIIFANIVNLVTYKFNTQASSISYKKAVYLFIDEIDLLAEAPAKEQREMNELFRHLYDYCPSAFCLVLSFTATAAEIPILFAPYVISRLTRQIILNPMSPAEAKGFIKEILDSERRNYDGLTGYYPFEESAIDLIVGNLVTITPRKIINTMQQTIEEIRLLDFMPSRDNLITRNYLDGTDIIVDILGDS